MRAPSVIDYRELSLVVDDHLVAGYASGSLITISRNSNIANQTVGSRRSSVFFDA